MNIRKAKKNTPLVFMLRRTISIFLTSIIALTITGCLRITADELYSLPEISEEYVKLQAQINMVLNRGAEYAAPTRGPNRQAVQLADLNSSGSNEVIALFSFPSESKLMIYIFTMADDDYIAADIIESAGTEIESVRYIDMDGDGNKEIVIGWQIGSTLKYLSIYSTVGFHSQLLMSGEEYNEVTSINAANGNGEDVVVIKLPTQEMSSPIAKVFSLMPDGEIVTEEARLSAGVESISRVLAGKLEDNSSALFIESEGRFENGGVVTDILARQNGSITNITLQPTTGVSDDTVRLRMNSTDITEDGIIMVPTLRRLISQSETDYYAIDWYMYHSNGTRTLSLTTYHNTFDEWYLILPTDWREKVSVRREDATPGERTIIFSYFGDDIDNEHEDFLKIYKFSGENAAGRAQSGNRMLLLIQGSAAYAFELLTLETELNITLGEDMIRENFKLIHVEWQP